MSLGTASRTLPLTGFDLPENKVTSFVPGSTCKNECLAQPGQFGSGCILGIVVVVCRSTSGGQQ